MAILRPLTTILLITSFALFAAACGKRGPLVYPDLMIPAAPTSVEARQLGSSVRLSCQLPAEPATAVRIYRQQASLQESFCSNCSDSLPLYKTIYVDALRGGERRSSLLLLLDTDVEYGQRYRYRLAIVTKDGTVGTASVPLSVAITEPFAAPRLSVESTPTEATLRISGERPAADSFIGYRIYRNRSDESRSLQPLVPEAVREQIYTDFMLKIGMKYRYSIRSVYKNSQGEIAESLLSNEVEAERAADE